MNNNRTKNDTIRGLPRPRVFSLMDLTGIFLVIICFISIFPSFYGTELHSRRMELEEYIASRANSPLSAPDTDIDINSFIRISNTTQRFIVGNNECKPFYISGINLWEAVEAASGALRLFGATLPGNRTTGPALVRSLLQKAQHAGMNVVRLWAHPVSKQYALMDGPGSYNEHIFRGLDYFIDEARKHNIRLLLVLVDNWQPTGGVDQFVGWARQVQQSEELSHEDFFSNELLKTMYKNHVSALLNRVNSVNGRVYKDDPTIFAWNLINEPRCYKCATLGDWIAEMATFVKSIDSQHLLTVGEEGFYASGTPQAAFNPNGKGANSSWANNEGQNFLADHENVDFAAIHLWHQNWDDASQPFVENWITQHIKDAKTIGKPLLLEEFGAWGVGQYLEQRDIWYDMIYKAVLKDMDGHGSPIQGALFWQLLENGQRAPPEESETPGGIFGIFSTDSTWNIINAFTASIQQLNAISPKSQPSCAAKGSPRTPSSAAPARSCSHTWVGGVEDGTGYEGAECSVDINECARGTHGCSINAACINTIGEYECMCYEGFDGDGKQCSPMEDVLSKVQQSYYTYGPGIVACDEGRDVIYPMNAPGYAYDLIHGDSGGNVYGSRWPVTALECMLACDAAPGCDSFTYNELMQGCFLKSSPSSQLCSRPETLCVATRGQTYSCGIWQTYFNSSLIRIQAAEGQSTGALAKQFTWLDKYLTTLKGGNSTEL